MTFLRGFMRKIWSSMFELYFTVDAFVSSFIYVNELPHFLLND